MCVDYLLLLSFMCEAYFFVVHLFDVVFTPFYQVKFAECRFCGSK